MPKNLVRASPSFLRVSIAAAVVVSAFAGATQACIGLNVCTPIDCDAAYMAANHLDPHYLGGKQSQPVDFVPLRASGNNVRFLSNLPLSKIGGGTAGSSLYGWVDPLTQREYALMGRTNGTAIVDITDPVNPRYVANVPKQTGTADTSWREPKVVNNYMYIGIDGATAGMQIVDLTRVRAFAGTTLTLNADATYTGVSKIHTLAVSPGTPYLYAAGTSAAGGGLHVLNVSNPLAPTVVANWATDGYTHENQVVTYNGPDTTYAGHEISFSSNGRSATGDAFSVVDLTNKSAVVRLSTKTYAQVGYIHQGWLTEDQRYFLMNDELDESNNLTSGVTRTHFWDVSDLDNPVYKGFYAHNNTSIDHNLYIKDGLVFMSNYTAGVRVFKLDDLTSTNPTDWMHEVGFYDTYAANNAATFNGTWNNYPFFPSGNIAVSDINGGLFVLAMGRETPEPSTMLCAGLALSLVRRTRK